MSRPQIKSFFGEHKMFGSCDCIWCAIHFQVAYWMMTEQIFSEEQGELLEELNDNKKFKFGDSLDLPCRVKPNPS